jgi:clan AA aspartic protease (TIGR02281 family)
MAHILANRWVEPAQTGFGSLRLALKWCQIGAAASVLLLSVSAPSRAGDIGSFIGGVVGGIIGQQQPQPQPQPNYQQYNQQQQDAAAAEARREYLARQAALKKKAQQDKDKKDQEAAAAAGATAASAPGGPVGPFDVTMKRKDGNLWVPVQINNVVTIDFVVDSGASDITLPRDVYQTLVRSGTLTKANFIGSAQFNIADGTAVQGLKFKLASLQVGNQVLTDVVASVMPSDAATPLLGLSFLSRFQSWTIDNNAGTFRLTPIPGSTTTMQMAAAAPQPLPAPPSVAPPTVATPAPMAPTAPSAVPAGVPGLQMAADAPRSGHVGNSALIVTESPTADPTATPPDPATAKADTAPVVPVFPANTPYADARSSLMALGYGPAPLPDAGKCDADTDTTCFPERAACKKADGIHCDFLWKRGDQLIKVKTVAVPPTVAAVECQVNCK